MRNPLHPLSASSPNTSPIIAQFRGLAGPLASEEERAELVAKTFSEAVLVASEQIRAGSLPLPLIPTETFAGPCVQITETAKGALIFSPWEQQQPRHATIVKDAEAADRLSQFCPIIKHLSFAGYIIAGGAPSWAVRKEAYQRPPGDVDIFPVVSPGMSDGEKEIEATRIYIAFLQEIRRIYDQHFASTHVFFWFRNATCTTIEIIDERIPDNAMKLQYIHRVHDSVAQVLGGFDLSCAQVSFDGKAFQCTYIAMLAVATGVIPLDFSRISRSWSFRLRKYQNKGYTFLALGLSAESITKEPIEFARGVVLSRGRRDSRICMTFAWDRIQESNRAAAADGPSLVHDVAESDYSGLEKSVAGQQALRKANIRNVLHNGSMLVTASDLDSFVHSAHGTDIDGPWPPFDREIAKIKQTGVIRKPVMQLLYGADHYREALAHCSSEDWTALDVLTKKRIAELQPIMERGFAEAKHVQWSLCRVGDRQYGAFNPLPLRARDFYGPHFDDGSYATPTGQQKIAFVWAMKERNQSQPVLLKLPLVLIRFILGWLDHIAVVEIVNRAMNWSIQ
jgi:hypothetical protein